MAKKKKEDKRNIQIKFLVTDEEKKLIYEYAGLARQSKSDFIRTAIWDKIEKIGDKIDKINIKTIHAKKAVLTGLKGALKAHTKDDFLIKPDEKEVLQRTEEKKKRKEELEKVKEVLEK